MIPNEKKLAVLGRIKEIESVVVSIEDGQATIGAKCRIVCSEAAHLKSTADSLAPVLRTALVINWKESAMKSRYDRFKRLFPEVTTLFQLKSILDRTDPVEFCVRYLNINASSAKNPKYCLLRRLTDGFLEYQSKLGLASEVDAIRHWAERVDPYNLQDDPIGKLHGVGPATVDNIRLNLGCDVVKGDRHVIGVMRRFLEVDIPESKYVEFARFLGMDVRYLDCLLFEYGKIKNLSG